MQSIFPLTESDRSQRTGAACALEFESDGQQEKPFDLDVDPPGPSSNPSESREFVMGPRQIASLAFVGILIIGIMSAVFYFAGRKNTEQQQQPKITERVIER